MTKLAVGCSKVVIMLLLIHSLIVASIVWGICVWSLFGKKLLSVLSTFALGFTCWISFAHVFSFIYC